MEKALVDAIADMNGDFCLYESRSEFYNDAIEEFLDLEDRINRDCEDNSLNLLSISMPKHLVNRISDFRRRTGLYRSRSELVREAARWWIRKNLKTQDSDTPKSDESVMIPVGNDVYKKYKLVRRTSAAG